MSKGSKQRPTNKQLFNSNYEDIDWRRWSEHSDGIDPQLTDKQLEELRKIVKRVREASLNEEMDVTQD